MKNTIALYIPSGHQIDAFEIIDQAGQLVFYTNDIHQHMIDVSDLHPGLFHILLKEQGKIMGSKRFVKM